MMGNLNQGKTHSEETKGKIAIALKGNLHTKGYLHDATMRLRCSQAKLAEKNPAWIGGKSFAPYTPEWTPELKQRIKDRDNHTCQLCHKILDDMFLFIHHIDYDKTNNSKVNLITLCHSCHSKTNHHRTEWGIYDGQFQRNAANVKDRYEGSPRSLCRV